MWYSERDLDDDVWSKLEYHFGEIVERNEPKSDDKSTRLITEMWSSGIRKEILEVHGNISSASIFIPANIEDEIWP